MWRETHTKRNACLRERLCVQPLLAWISKSSGLILLNIEILNLYHPLSSLLPPLSPFSFFLSPHLSSSPLSSPHLPCSFLFCHSFPVFRGKIANSFLLKGQSDKGEDGTVGWGMRKVRGFSVHTRESDKRIILPQVHLGEPILLK